MLNCTKICDVSFLEDTHYQTYLKGKSQALWDSGLDWSMASDDLVPEHLKRLAVDIASMSAHVEVLGMQNAAELLAKCEDFSLKIGLGQAVNDEARHAELFAKYALLANGAISDCSKTQELYDNHFDSLSEFDEIFLSHVFLENGALEQFNIFISTFGEESLIGQIYKGALQDEARHVQMGINYFRQKVQQQSSYRDIWVTHLNTYQSVLHVNESAIRWLSEFSGIDLELLSQRIEKRQASFINKILAEV